ncbi:hypothetical protein C2G38_2038257 [Gigaspora rosea]|uniref:Protein kinase domain-containing protein n=1 Tax=Gigaspora rosea TaxID=44941 RepID=A0A397V482_9GLOM|nr:hypothetical protein C2G38_2038257 [Gigaspora rosea]
MDSKQLFTLGYNYQFGIGVEKDEKKAFEYYMQAAELGDSSAMQNVSLYGTGVEINYQKSFEYCKRSADLGNAYGMCSVGNRYKQGQGVAQDQNKAFEYYEKSANIGIKEAMYNVARCYRNGIGTKRDIQSANYWFTKCKSLLKTNKSPDHINPELKRILDDERFKLSWIDYKELKIAGNGSLRQNLVEVSQLEWKDKLNILNGIAFDLESIHSQELVHRDLHSGNILQEDALQYAYITDLGLTKNEKDGKICGIIPYIAPEVLVGQPYTKASDIYSLGVIMTEISTGQRAFDGIPFDN